MPQQITIPDIGENVKSGTVVNILVKEGDVVEQDQPIIEFETDKAVVEIPAPQRGKISRILVKEGDEVDVGGAIAQIEAAAGEGKGPAVEAPPEEQISSPQSAGSADSTEREVSVPPSPGQPAEPDPRPTAVRENAPRAAAPVPADEAILNRPRLHKGPAPAPPSVRRLARELGVDINAVPASGPGGRITEDDVKTFVKQFMTRVGGHAAGALAERELPDFSTWGPIRREPANKVRRIIAENVAYYWHTIPHVTQFDKADITELEAFRTKYAKAAETQGGKLTPTAILLKVVAHGLRRFPQFNASIDTINGEIIYKDYVHIGMAVDTPAGLLVPVIRDVDKKPIVRLAIELAELAERTRQRKVGVGEFEGATFSISNQGSIGGTDFTPIVLWPQVAILGVSRGSVQPVWIDGQFQPRTLLPLSLSYDHRMVDGADAARFVRWLCEALEHPFLMEFE